MKVSIRLNWFAYISLLLAGNAVIAAPNVSGSNSKNESIKLAPWIIGGKQANIRDYPFIVSIQHYSQNWNHHCGGSIVTATVVLTACHCVVVTPRPRVYKQARYFRVLAGADHLYYDEDARQIVGIHRFEAHPRCTDGTWADDTAVLILSEGLRFTRLVQPMKLHSTDMDEAADKIWRLEHQNTMCSVAGWGVKDYDNNISPVLKKAPIKIMSSRACDKLNCKVSKACGNDYWRMDQVCAIDPKSIFCNGDSGGPLVCNGQVFGVVSYNYGCRVGTPMTFADITAVLSVVGKYLYGEEAWKAKIPIKKIHSAS